MLLFWNIFFKICGNYTCLQHWIQTWDLRIYKIKVQFDIRFYFMRRASENIDEFKKNTFSTRLDVDSNIMYVSKDKDELTKITKKILPILCLVLCQKFVAVSDVLWDLSTCTMSIWIQNVSSFGRSLDLQPKYRNRILMCGILNKNWEWIHWLHSCLVLAMQLICHRFIPTIVYVLQEPHSYLGIISLQSK